MNATFEVNPLIESLPVTSAWIGATNHGINPFFSPLLFSLSPFLPSTSISRLLSD